MNFTHICESVIFHFRKCHSKSFVTFFFARICVFIHIKKKMGWIECGKLSVQHRKCNIIFQSEFFSPWLVFGEQKRMLQTTFSWFRRAASHIRCFRTLTFRVGRLTQHITYKGWVERRGKRGRHSLCITQISRLNRTSGSKW